MLNESIYTSRNQNKNIGKLQVYVNADRNNEPIENARIRIYPMSNLDLQLEEVFTNISGQSPMIELPAPPKAYSMEPMKVLPYEPYMIQISAPQKMTVEIYGAQIFPEVTAIQPVKLIPAQDDSNINKIIIDPHTLSSYYSPQVVGEQEKQVIDTGEPVIIPDHVIIHTSVPSDEIAPNLCTGYKEYIKNVVSNEIYPTWPIETIYANILATLSFTLNRIYTNWYPKQGYNFNVTSRNPFDNKWVYGRNYYDNISTIVDFIFNYYLSKPGITQPILTPYCKGEFILCNSMMEKWISKELGEQGYNAIQILQHFFGDSLYINATNNISGVQYNWSVTNLSLNSSGNDVLVIQQYLNKIAAIYTEIPVIEVNGIYDKYTAKAVKKYQIIFHLPSSGIVDVGTWYSIMMFFNKYNNVVLEC